jgi:hypothetical protein
MATDNPQRVPDLPISDLRASLNGKVIGSDDAAYDEARSVFFTGFDRRPAAIVRVADASDVSRVVTLARETGAELAVRSGGHSPAGHGTSEGGIVLDLSAMNAVEIDGYSAPPGCSSSDAGSYGCSADDGRGRGGQTPGGLQRGQVHHPSHRLERRPRRG